MSVYDNSKALFFTGGTLPTGGVSPGELGAEIEARENAVAAEAQQRALVADELAGTRARELDGERATGASSHKRVALDDAGRALILHSPDSAELDLKLSPLAAHLARQADADDRGLVGGKTPLTYAGGAVVESMTSRGDQRWDNPIVDRERDLCRGAFISKVSNGRVIEAITPEGGVKTAGSSGQADAIGRHSFFEGDGYTGYTYRGSVYHLRNGVTIKVPRSGIVQLRIQTGQSWISQNGQNGRLARFAAPLQPHTVLMPNDASGVTIPAGADPNLITGLEPYYEKQGSYQSVSGPTGLVMDAIRTNSGRDGAFILRGIAIGGTSLTVLSDPVNYANYLTTIAKIKDFVESLGLALEIPLVDFEHGAADSSMTYAEYKTAMTGYLDAVAHDAKALTGQPFEPVRIIGQPPGFANSPFGAWPCLQAQVDICHERPGEYVFAGAGWHYPQNDQTHYTGESAAARGAQYAYCGEAVLSGGKWGAPYIYRPYRDGATIYCPVEGGLDVYAVPAGELPETERHGIIDAAGVWSRVPHEGFGFTPTSGTATITSVEVLPRMIRITLSEGAAGRLTHAWYSLGDRRKRLNGDGSTYTKNESANRGTIRARRDLPSFYDIPPASLWLASGYWDL